MDNIDLKQELIAAYEIIREQTAQICDLQNLLVPLIKALEADDHRRLRESMLKVQESRLDEAIETKSASLDYVDAAILRLKGKG